MPRKEKRRSRNLIIGVGKGVKGLVQAVVAAHRKGFAQGLEELVVTHYIRLGEFLESLGVERQVEHISGLGQTADESLRAAPDTGFFAERLGHPQNQVVGGKGLVVAQVVDPGWDVIALDELPEGEDHIIDAAKRAAVFEGAQRPGQPPADHRIQEIQIAFVTGSVDHGRAKDVDPLAIGQDLGEDVLLGKELADPVVGGRMSRLRFGEDGIGLIGSGFYGAEKDEGLSIGGQEGVEELFGELGVDLIVRVGARGIL